MIRPLKEMPYAQACVRTYDNGMVVLQSYKTDVIYVIDDWMTVTGIYSRTTIRHISAFMKEMSAKYGYNFTYQMAKACWRDNYRLNLATGEVQDI